MMRETVEHDEVHAGEAIRHPALPTLTRLGFEPVDEVDSIEEAATRPNTSKPTPGHTIFPYLLLNMAVTRPNQVWAMDIIQVIADLTCRRSSIMTQGPFLSAVGIPFIPMKRGFAYLAAVGGR